MSLAIECGATSSDAIFVTDDGSVKKHIRLGAANYKLIDEAKLKNFFKEIHEILSSFSIRSIGVGLPGILDSADATVNRNR